MNTGLNRRYGVFGGAVDQAVIDESLRSYMLKVYNLMGSGLALSGMVAIGTYQAGLHQYGLIGSLAALGVMLVMTFGANKLSAGVVSTLYWVFVALMGFGLSGLFAAYTGASIARVFFITAATFGAMSLWGYTTKRDLSKMGSFLMMGLIGILIAGVVNIFVASSMLQFVISVVGVLVFTLLTAFDTQRIKAEFNEADPAELQQKQAIFGAVSLYLNFINLFQLLLSLLGNRE
jgi:FtsH-binding integral membrane protein